MPFLIRPPLYYSENETDNAQLTDTIIEPDDRDRTILQDLQGWGWRLTRHDFNDEMFIEVMAAIEKDDKKQRRKSHFIGNQLHGYQGRPRLEDLWEIEAQRALQRGAFEVEQPDQPGLDRKDERDEHLEEEADECFKDGYQMGDAEGPLQGKKYEHDDEQYDGPHDKRHDRQDDERHEGKQKRQLPAYEKREHRTEKVEKYVSYPCQLLSHACRRFSNILTKVAPRHRSDTPNKWLSRLRRSRTSSS
jgi:hypothetical protein